MSEEPHKNQATPWIIGGVVALIVLLGCCVVAVLLGAIGFLIPVRTVSITQMSSGSLIIGTPTPTPVFVIPIDTPTPIASHATEMPEATPTGTMTPAITLTELQTQQLAFITAMAPDYTWPLDVCSQDGNIGCDEQGHIFALAMSGLGIQAIPAEIGQLTYLQLIDLSGNNLRSLPPEIGQLTKLEQLTLNNNRLTSLPPEIGRLSELIYLNVNMNSITSLPPEIGQLHSLTKLDLSFNQLTSLPPEISQLSNLRTLYVSQNELTSLPPEVCAKFGAIISPSELCQ